MLESQVDGTFLVEDQALSLDVGIDVEWCMLIETDHVTQQVAAPFDLRFRLGKRRLGIQLFDL